jgi:hypothetical protein
MNFPSYWEFQKIPTDGTPSFFREVETTNQLWFPCEFSQFVLSVSQVIWEDNGFGPGLKDPGRLSAGG